MQCQGCVFAVEAGQELGTYSDRGETSGVWEIIRSMKWIEMVMSGLIIFAVCLCSGDRSGPELAMLSDLMDMSFCRMI